MWFWFWRRRIAGSVSDWEPSYLLKADDSDGTVLVVVMMIVMIDGKQCVQWFLLIMIILTVLIHIQCIAKPMACLLRNHLPRLHHRKCLISNANMLSLHVIRRNHHPSEPHQPTRQQARCARIAGQSQLRPRLRPFRPPL